MNPPPSEPHAVPRQFIYHLLPQADWDRARATGVYAPAGLAAEGFIHCSTIAQLAGVAERYFAGRADVVILRIDPARLSAPVRYEPSEPGQLFPHLYGTLELEAVAESRRLDFDSEDRALLPAQWQPAPGAGRPRAASGALARKDDHGSSPAMD
ncbi:MAG TPA: DUF952 domain-containing protein [Anaerolineales bacterium]|nr:DUF952 domain-containing protein [Anaerolineales bacterium]